MRVAYYVTLVGCTLPLVNLSAARADEDDQARLQGKWIVESFEYNGNPVEVMKDAIREFKDGKYSLAPTMREAIEGTLKLDPSKKPKEIDLAINGRTLKGIYELDGDTLKMSYNLGDGDRPTEFVSKPDSRLVLVIHKRAK